MARPSATVSSPSVPTLAPPAPSPVAATRSFSASAPSPAAAPQLATTTSSDPLPSTSAQTKSWAPPPPSPLEPISRSQSYDAKVSVSIFLLLPPLKFTSREQPNLEAENARLESELREAREKIRYLELQVETIRANARKAAQTLLSE